MLVLNLDTNHVSELVRNPEGDGCAEVIQVLQKGDVALGLSHLHLVELSAPDFAEYPELAALLRNTPVILLNPREDIFEEEAAYAVARATGRERPPPRVFAKDVAEWGYHPGPPGYGALEMLEYFRDREPARQELLEMGEYNAKASRMKTAAAVVKDPTLPSRLLLADHLNDFRQRNREYGDGLTPEEVLARVGGVSGLPAYAVDQGLVIQRLSYPNQKTKPNDLFDEYVASFAPYCAVTALDKRTVHRMKAAKLPSAPRVTRYLREVRPLLERVKAGELAIEPSRSSWYRGV